MIIIFFILSSISIIDQEKYTKAKSLEKGAYIISEAQNDPEIILIGTGSEVQLVLAAQEKLKEKNIDARVVSMPSWELFEEQSKEYKEIVLPKDLRKRLAVEAASPMGWGKYVTDEGDVIGVEGFGESAPGEEVLQAYGFTVENVVERALALV